MQGDAERRADARAVLQLLETGDVVLPDAVYHQMKMDGHIRVVRQHGIRCRAGVPDVFLVGGKGNVDGCAARRKRRACDVYRFGNQIVLGKHYCTSVCGLGGSFGKVIA